MPSYGMLITILQVVNVARPHWIRCLESFDDTGFCKVVNGANLVVPDGVPLVWGLKGRMIGCVDKIGFSAYAVVYV